MNLSSGQFLVLRRVLLFVWHSRELKLSFRPSQSNRIHVAVNLICQLTLAESFQICTDFSPSTLNRNGLTRVLFEAGNLSFRLLTANSRHALWNSLPQSIVPI